MNLKNATYTLRSSYSTTTGRTPSSIEVPFNAHAGRKHWLHLDIGEKTVGRFKYGGYRDTEEGDVEIIRER